VLAVDTGTSQWLMIFSFFFFFFLVLVKRHAELLLHVKSLEDDPTGRGYQIDDIHLIQSFAVASALLSLLVFGLYIASPRVQALYTSPNYLWLVASLGLLWVIDVLVLVHKGEMHHDPIVHVFTNKRSLGILLVSIIFVFLSL
jgi:4-hydroxybenzoate polyprenyltransferase